MLPKRGDVHFFVNCAIKNPRPRQSGEVVKTNLPCWKTRQYAKTQKVMKD
jgi:hypothetical protein